MAVEQPTKQPRTVTSDGQSLALVPDGVIFRDLVTHTDARGSVVELFNPVWKFHPDPLEHAYMFTVRPGVTKGWGRHDHTTDRYAILFGEGMVTLYDDRDESPTKGLVAEIPMTEHHRRLIVIPAGIWHAVTCVGESDLAVVSFKTSAFDHGDPDKYTLPLDTDLIPFDFGKYRRR